MRELKSSYPNLFIVGAPKSGTTAMARHLVAHPGIYTPLQKEFTYFGKDLVRYAELITEKAYLKWFEAWKDEKYALDASPFYLYSDSAPREFLEKSPDAKIIIMLRNPVEVAYSMYFEALFGNREDAKTFEEAWELESKRLQGECMPTNARLEYTTRYQSLGLYSSHITHYRNIFGADNVHIILFDDFKDNNQVCYEKLLDFLGLPYIYPESFKVHNPSKIARSPKLTHFVTTPPKWMGTVGSFILPKTTRWKIRDFIKNKNMKIVDKPKIAPATKAMLQAHYAEEIVELENLLDRSLSQWK
ncbi:sulfotransferase family protein [Aliiglaciecola lipolytica]|uniref:sulfotransferase family protein n=1 Tax=Aliiglaciecola lipolytica TaxID=477689 RepID=UPI001C0A04B6|nr:sulfotransferase [Aliiglaciecola lipolytica]MBU2877830.1 sulfotransferase [Aliiglaciecola lipolytica]